MFSIPSIFLLKPISIPIHFQASSTFLVCWTLKSEHWNRSTNTENWRKIDDLPDAIHHFQNAVGASNIGHWFGFSFIFVFFFYFSKWKTIVPNACSTNPSRPNPFRPSFGVFSNSIWDHEFMCSLFVADNSQHLSQQKHLKKKTTRMMTFKKSKDARKLFLRTWPIRLFVDVSRFVSISYLGVTNRCAFFFFFVFISFPFGFRRSFVCDGLMTYQSHFQSNSRKMCLQCKTWARLFKQCLTTHGRSRYCLSNPAHQNAYRKTDTNVNNSKVNFFFLS